MLSWKESGCAGYTYVWIPSSSLGGILVLSSWKLALSSPWFSGTRSALLLLHPHCLGLCPFSRGQFSTQGSHVAPFASPLLPRGSHLDVALTSAPTAPIAARHPQERVCRSQGFLVQCGNSNQQQPAELLAGGNGTGQ